MAGSAQKLLGKVIPPVKNEKTSLTECAVCLQTCIHPAELPCRHVFCYLCIKGIVNQGRRCAMCRRDIPVDYLDKPRLLNPVEAEIGNQGFEDGHLWFYEGHNGWWQYDGRTSLELETAYQKGERCCELLIAGFLYVADFDEMLQYRRNDPSKRRRIKRDLATTNKKGVAGLKTSKFTNSVSSNSTGGEYNEVIHSWSNSNASATANFNFTRTITPTVISNVSTEPVNHQQLEEGLLLGVSHATCSRTPPGNSSPPTESSGSYSRNFDFGTVTHETLDWTIEQIESLNLELLNDYEVLFRDVNNYGRSQSNLNQNRSEGVIGNYLTQYLSRSYALRESLENESEATYRSSGLSELSNENNDSEPLAVSPRELSPEEDHPEEEIF